MEALRRRFPAVDFVKIYVSEAHPIDEWRCYAEADVDYAQPTRLADRLAAARRLLDENDIGAPLYLDSMRNDAERLYAAHPERLYVVVDGAVAYKGGKGLFGYLPDDLEAWLEARGS